MRRIFSHDKLQVILDLRTSIYEISQAQALKKVLYVHLEPPRFDAIFQSKSTHFSPRKSSFDRSHLLIGRIGSIFSMAVMGLKIGLRTLLKAIVKKMKRLKMRQY